MRRPTDILLLCGFSYLSPDPDLMNSLRNASEAVAGGMMTHLKNMRGLVLLMI